MSSLLSFRQFWVSRNERSRDPLAIAPMTLQRRQVVRRLVWRLHEDICDVAGADGSEVDVLLVGHCADMNVDGRDDEEEII